MPTDEWASLEVDAHGGTPRSASGPRCYMRCDTSSHVWPTSHPKAAMTCTDGGRYWDRTSDLFRVRDRKPVRTRPPTTICAGQTVARRPANMCGHARTGRGWGTCWGTPPFEQRHAKGVWLYA